MPTYRVKDTNTNEEYDLVKGISEMDEYLKENPHLKRVPIKAGGIVDAIRIGVTKHSGDFKEVMETIHEKSPGSNLKDSFRW